MTTAPPTDFRREAALLRAQSYYVTSRVRCAARLARITDLSIHEAAQVFGVSAGGVWLAWGRMFPCIPQPTNTQRRCECRGEQGHVAVRGTCSPTHLAMRMIAGGATVIEASKTFGLSVNGMYSARSRAA